MLSTGSKTLHAVCEIYLHLFRGKLLYDFDYKSPKQYTYSFQINSHLN